jgi:lipopolysaccharide assembly protein B
LPSSPSPRCPLIPCSRRSGWTLAGTLAIGWGITSWRTLVRRNRRLRRRARYLEGVRFLLDDKPDRALEVFLSLSEIDDETDRYAFRARQPVPAPGRSRSCDSRASAHRRPRSLSEDTRDAALSELARDYFRAGLYDRAEELFLTLAESGREPALALSHLVRIYEIQHEWQQAADACTSGCGK